MKVFLAAILFVGLCVLGFGVNIFFRGKEFPEWDVSKNKDMRRMGIKCMHQIDAEIHNGRKRSTANECDEAKNLCDGNYDEACRDCALYEYEKKQ